MTDTDFDGLPALAAGITQVVVLDPDGTPNKVLDSELAFQIRVNWKVTPAAVAVLLDGTWNVRAFVESIGPGSEKLAAQSAKAADGGLTYSDTLTVPPGTLRDDTPPSSGVYKLAVVITYTTTTGVLTEMAGYIEGQTFLVRTP